jgi:hypothetical protein
LYTTLQDLQGISIPFCHGCFILEFPDREFLEDRHVSVILIDYIPGNLLCPKTLSKMSLSAEEKEVVRRKVLK